MYIYNILVHTYSLAVEVHTGGMSPEAAHTHTPTHPHTHTHAYTRVHTHVHSDLCIYMYNMLVHTYSLAGEVKRGDMSLETANTHAHTHTHTHTHTHMHKHTHARTHTRILRFIYMHV